MGNRKGSAVNARPGRGLGAGRFRRQGQQQQGAAVGGGEDVQLRRDRQQQAVRFRHRHPGRGGAGRPGGQRLAHRIQPGEQRFRPVASYLAAALRAMQPGCGLWQRPGAEMVKAAAACRREGGGKGSHRAGAGALRCRAGAAAEAEIPALAGRFQLSQAGGKDLGCGLRVFRDGGGVRAVRKAEARNPALRHGEGRGGTAFDAQGDFARQHGLADFPQHCGGQAVTGAGCRSAGGLSQPDQRLVQAGGGAGTGLPGLLRGFCHHVPPI
ncbi:hypothetical protein RA26_20660 [Leisingera sp. ANG-M7]|nr:hypothetical protein RA26_20660 [Leisingera sp. ANG-M7]